MNKQFKDTFLGLLLALLVTLFTSIILTFIMIPKSQTYNALERLFSSGIITKILALGSLPNVLLFHLFIKKNKYYQARGVLIVVFIFAVVFAILKLKA